MCMSVLVFRGWAVKAADSDGQWSGTSTQTLRTGSLPSVWPSVDHGTKAPKYIGMPTGA